MTTTIPTTADPQLERELFALVRRERRARDTGDWDGLAGLYWPGSVVRVTWFEGPAEGYIERSRATRVPGRVPGMHPINPAWSAVQGDRALVERYPMAFLARVYVTFLRRDDEEEETRQSLPLSRGGRPVQGAVAR